MASRLPHQLTNRTMSGFPVSIGTGLALEAIFTPIEESLHEAPPTPLPDPSIYTSYVFNVETLIRNLLNSLTYQDTITIRHKHFLEVIVEEIHFLSSFFESNNTQALFYTNSYQYFRDTYKDKIRNPTTDKQHLTSAIIDYVLKHAPREIQEVQQFSKDISFGKDQKSLLLSHVPADLLSFSKFSTLDLLESHTGTIKSRRHWNTKYYPIPQEDMSFLPFLEYLWSVFGDRQLIKPSPIKERKQLLINMQKAGVNPLTSEFSMALGLGKR